LLDTDFAASLTSTADAGGPIATLPDDEAAVLAATLTLDARLAASFPDDEGATSLLALLPVLVPLMALDAFCINDAADHRDEVAGAALAFSFGVIGRGTAGALSADCFAAAPRPLEEEDGVKEDDEVELCRDELTVGRRKDGIGLSDDAEDRPMDCRGASEVRGLDGGLPAPALAPLLLLGRRPSLDRGDGRAGMGCFCCMTELRGFTQ
jgi:hypothetical protein